MGGRIFTNREWFYSIDLVGLLYCGFAR